MTLDCFWLPSSSGLGRCPLKAETAVRTCSGVRLSPASRNRCGARSNSQGFPPDRAVGHRPGVTVTGLQCCRPATSVLSARGSSVFILNQPVLSFRDRVQSRSLKLRANTGALLPTRRLRYVAENAQRPRESAIFFVFSAVLTLATMSSRARRTKITQRAGTIQPKMIANSSGHGLKLGPLLI